jgi:hypothetical protein
MTTMAVSETGTRKAIDLGSVFKHGWGLFIKDVVHLLVGTVVATLLSIVSIGILAGPLFAGLYQMVLARVKDGKEPRWDDVFGGLDRFWAYLGAALFLVVVIGLAWITIVGGILLGTIWLYVFPLMVDKRMGLGEALGASYRLVRENGFWEHLVLVVLFAIIGSIGGPAFLVTLPLTIAATVAAYLIADGREAELERV